MSLKQRGHAMRTFDFAPFYRSTVGFDRLFSMLDQVGGVESAACILAIKNGIVPPTINLDNPDPYCDLDYVPNAARTKKVRLALNNSFGFGGHNATLAFRALD